MTGPKFIVLFLCIMLGCSPVLSLLDSKTPIFWKTNIALFPFICGSFVLQVSTETPTKENEEELKLTQKAIKGKKLLDGLTESLEELKKALEENTEIQQDTLDKVMQVKDDFRELQEEPGELPQEMLTTIRQKIFESFRLVMQVFNLDKHVKPRKSAKQDKAKESIDSGKETESKRPEESEKQEEIKKPGEEDKKTAETEKQKVTKKSKKSAKARKSKKLDDASKSAETEAAEATVESEEVVMEPIGAENKDNQVDQNVENREKRVNEEL